MTKFEQITQSPETLAAWVTNTINTCFHASKKTEPINPCLPLKIEKEDFEKACYNVTVNFFNENIF